MSQISWWGTKVRQFRAHVGARVTAEERLGLAAWLTPAQLALFDGMHVADRRHGLDVVATLKTDGALDQDLLMAGLLHDAGKGRGGGVWPRVAWSLGEAYGPWVWRAARVLPGFGPAIDRLRDHANLSARLAESAGCQPRTIDLIRHQASPLDPDAGWRLLLADEAN